MGMNEAEAAKSATARAKSAPIRELGAGSRTEHDVLHGSGPVEKHTDLAARVGRNFGQRACEFVVDDAVRLDAAACEAFEGFDLAGFEAGGIAVDLNGVLLLVRLLAPRFRRARRRGRGRRSGRAVSDRLPTRPKG